MAADAVDMTDYREFPILYVHDDPQAAVVVLRYVLGEDFTVLSARELTEAVALAGENELGLVLCEQSVLGMPGVEICARLRDVQPHVPRIVTTTHAGRQISVDAVQAGHIAGHVGKPWQHPEFVSLVRAKVDLVRMRASMRMRQLDPRIVRAKKLADTIVLDDRRDALSGTDVARALRGLAQSLAPLQLSVHAEGATRADIHPVDLVQTLALLLYEAVETAPHAADTVRAEARVSGGQVVIALVGPERFWSFATATGDRRGGVSESPIVSMSTHLVRRAGGEVLVEDTLGPLDTLILRLPPSS